MTRRDELLALAERCEKASEGTFQLDEAIALTTGLYVRERRGKDRQEWFYPADGRGFGRRSIYPLSDLGMHRYTTSLDAAMTLVPEDCYWLLGKGRTRPDERLYGFQVLDSKTNEVISEAEHESRACCVVAAALRAQAERED